MNRFRSMRPVGWFPPRNPFPALPSLSDLLVFVIPYLTLVVLEPSAVLIPLEEEFGNLLLKPVALDLLQAVSKLGEIPLYSLFGHILKLFVWKIFF